jgi:putative membrane protein
MHGWQVGWYAWWPMWPFGMLIFSGLLVVAVWALVRTVYADTSKNAESADEILKRRYARGEIDRDTFERMLADLHGAGERHA